ncbi:hypothetical protein M514_06214, partial [Trichuris suis]
AFGPNHGPSSAPCCQPLRWSYCSQAPPPDQHWQGRQLSALLSSRPSRLVSQPVERASVRPTTAVTLQQDTNAKSPCDLFNYQCRHHGISPDFHYEVGVLQVSGAPPIHTCRLNVADVVVSGQGTTKKAAKHIAVAQFLRTLILRGTHEDWGLPKNQTDAFALIERLLFQFSDRMVH